MTIRDRKQLKVLVVLLVVLGGTVALAFRNNEPTAASFVPTAVEKKTTKGGTDPESDGPLFRLETVKPDPEQDQVGRKNLFQYGMPRQVEPAKQPALPPPTQFTQVLPPAPTVPAQPPPPPPMSFRYDAVVLKSSGGIITAHLTDNTGSYLVKEGEVLLGRYRIARLTETSAEIEDLDLNRRQTFVRVKQ